MSSIALLSSLNRAIHPNDALAPVYRAQYGMERYYESALQQVDVFDALANTYLGKPLAELGSIADFACHYGRLLRALRAAAPGAALVACDIDTEALSFCESEFGATPFHSAWSPSDLKAPPVVDLLFCISLLTHTRHTFFIDTLDLWKRMLRPSGLLAFTFLGKSYIGPWEAGEMAHYGPAAPEDIIRVSRDFAAGGHAFHSYPTGYSPTEYGVGFLSEELVIQVLATHPELELLEIRPGATNGFGQDMAIVRRRVAAA